MSLYFTILVYSLVIIAVSLQMRTVLNPVAIALGPLLLAMFIVVFDPVGYGYHETHIVTAMVLAIYGVAMMIPFFMIYRPINHKMHVHIFNRYSVNRLMLLAAMLLIIGLLAYFLKMKILLQENGVPLGIVQGYQFAISNVLIIEESMKSGYSTMHYLGFLGLIYAGYVFAAGCSDAGWLKKMLLMLLVLLYFVSLAGLFIKVQLIIGILLFFFSYAVSGGKGWLWGGAIMVLVGIAVAIIDNMMYSGRVDVAIEFILRYISGSVIGLDKYLMLERLPEARFASSTFDTLYFLLDRAGILSLERPDKIFFVISDENTTVNTGTILLTPYFDFGALGVAVFSILASFVSWWLMRRYQESGRLVYLVCYSIALCSLFLGFIGAVYKHLEFAVIVVLHLMLEFTGLLKRARQRTIHLTRLE